MNQIRAAVPTDALPIAVIYNQGIAERSSTFETKLSTAQDTLERINAAATFRVLVSGAGKQLLNELTDAASSLSYWKLLARVFPFNAVRRVLGRACGFRKVGVYQKHANLDGSWLDVVIVERLIPANLA
jgi:L-amino acid N-acyltransferase YncA